MIVATRQDHTKRGEFAREISRRRKRLGLTKIEAADRAGISLRWWYHLEDDRETNTYRPKPETVWKVAQALEWEPEEAFLAAGVELDPDWTPPPNATANKAEEAVFINLYRDLPPQTRRVLRKAMEDLKALPAAS
jgi:transcriptional regulator with XRE-family HTH domain